MSDSSDRLTGHPGVWAAKQLSRLSLALPTEKSKRATRFCRSVCKHCNIRAVHRSQQEEYLNGERRGAVLASRGVCSDVLEGLLSSRLPLLTDDGNAAAPHDELRAGSLLPLPLPLLSPEQGIQETEFECKRAVAARDRNRRRSTHSNNTKVATVHVDALVVARRGRRRRRRAHYFHSKLLFCSFRLQ